MRSDQGPQKIILSGISYQYMDIDYRAYCSHKIDAGCDIPNLVMPVGRTESVLKHGHNSQCVKGSVEFSR